MSMNILIIAKQAVNHTAINQTTMIATITDCYFDELSFYRNETGNENDDISFLEKLADARVSTDMTNVQVDALLGVLQEH